MKINPLVQLEELIAKHVVTIERPGVASEYEVTVYSKLRDGGHGHFGGATLAEAINRALAAQSESPAKGDAT